MNVKLRIRAMSGAEQAMNLYGKRELVVFDRQGIAHGSVLALHRLLNVNGVEISEGDRAKLEEAAKAVLPVDISKPVPVAEKSQDELDAEAAAEAAERMAALKAAEEKAAALAKPKPEDEAALAELRNEVVTAKPEMPPELADPADAQPDKIERSDEARESAIEVLDDLYVKELRKVAELNRVDISSAKNKGEICEVLVDFLSDALILKTVERLKADR